MAQEITRQSSIGDIKKKLEIMLAGRMRRKENILEAIKTQDRLSKKSGSWNGTEEIRKWREKR